MQINCALLCYRTQSHTIIKYEIKVRRHLRTKKEKEGLTLCGSESIIQSALALNLQVVASQHGWEHLFKAHTEGKWGQHFPCGILILDGISPFILSYSATQVIVEMTKEN